MENETCFNWLLEVAYIKKWRDMDELEWISKIHKIFESTCKWNWCDTFGCDDKSERVRYIID